MDTFSSLKERSMGIERFVLSSGDVSYSREEVKSFVYQKYSEDQPRDEDGRFGEGGGSGSGEEKLSNGLTSSQNSLMEQYSDQLAFKLNGSLREGTATDEEKAQAEKIDAVIKEHGSKAPVVVYRGASDEFTQALLDKAEKRNPDSYMDGLVGMTFTDKGFMSTSTDKDDAMDFATGVSERQAVLFTLRSSGRYNYDMSKVEGNAFEAQHERLFGSGTKIKITEANWSRIDGISVLRLSGEIK